MQALNAVKEALMGLNKSLIMEIKSLKRPSFTIKQVLEMLALIFGEKADSLAGQRLIME